MPSVGGNPSAGTVAQPVSISQWAVNLLIAGGWNSANSELILGIVAWAIAEDSDLGDGKGAEWNPLDTTQPAAGDSYFNSFTGSDGHVYHVRNYPDQATGLTATVTTLNNGYYSKILAVLSAASPSAEDLAAAVGGTGWGTGDFTSVVGNVRANPSAYYNQAVTGSASTSSISGITVPVPSTTSPQPGTSTAVAATVSPQYSSSNLAPTAGFRLATPGFGDFTVSDITINGKSLSADVTGAVTDVIVERSINNASTITVVLTDPHRTILRSDLLKFGALLQLDGLRFALVEIIKAGDQLELVFEAIGVVALRQQIGPIASTGDLTAFAQYLVQQANQAVPGLGMGFVGEPNPTLLATQNIVGRGTGSAPTTEDSWTCLVRLASAAGWRIWESDNTIFLGSDPFWLRYTAPQGPIQEFTEAVQFIDMTWDYAQPFGNLQVTALSSLWAFPPGTVMTTTGMGIADGNWLVADLQRSIYHPQASIQLMVPMTPAELIAATSGTPSTAASVVVPGSPSTGTPSITVTVYPGNTPTGTPITTLAAGAGFTVNCLVSGDGLGWTPTGTINFQSNGNAIIAGASGYTADAVPLGPDGSVYVTVPHGYGSGTFSITCSYTPASTDKGAPPGGTTAWQATDSSQAPITLVVQ